MITVVEFRAKEATKSRYMPTDELYVNYFLIKTDLDWLELTKNWARFQKIESFKNEDNQKVLLIKVIFSNFIFFNEKKIGQIWLIFELENQKFTTFQVLQSIQINSNEKIIRIYQWAYINSL